MKSTPTYHIIVLYCATQEVSGNGSTPTMAAVDICTAPTPTGLQQLTVMLTPPRISLIQAKRRSTPHFLKRPETIPQNNPVDFLKRPETQNQLWHTNRVSRTIDSVVDNPAHILKTQNAGAALTHTPSLFQTMIPIFCSKSRSPPVLNYSVYEIDRDRY